MEKTLTQITLKANKYYFLWALLILNLAGMPPLTGFFPKLMILTENIQNFFVILLIIMLLRAIVDFYIYLRICYRGFFLLAAKYF